MQLILIIMMMMNLIIGTPSPPTKSFLLNESLGQTFRETPYQILWTWEFPPLRIKSLLASDPSKPKLLVGRLAV